FLLFAGAPSLAAPPDFEMDCSVNATTNGTLPSNPAVGGPTQADVPLPSPNTSVTFHILVVGSQPNQSALGSGGGNNATTLQLAKVWLTGVPATGTFSIPANFNYVITLTIKDQSVAGPPSVSKFVTGRFTGAVQRDATGCLSYNIRHAFTATSAPSTLPAPGSFTSAQFGYTYALDPAVCG